MRQKYNRGKAFQVVAPSSSSSSLAVFLPFCDEAFPLLELTMVSLTPGAVCLASSYSQFTQISQSKESLSALQVWAKKPSLCFLALSIMSLHCTYSTSLLPTPDSQVHEDRGHMHVITVVSLDLSEGLGMNKHCGQLEAYAGERKQTFLCVENEVVLFGNGNSPDRNHRKEGPYQFNLLNCVNIVLSVKIVFTEFLEGRHQDVSFGLREYFYSGHTLISLAVLLENSVVKEHLDI